MDGSYRAESIESNISESFGWTHKFISPAGFDHTLVMYCPKRKIHVVITEPYEYTSLAAASRVKTSISGIPAAIIVCKRGTGIWNPPHCIPVLIGKEKHADSLVEFAKLLPSCKYEHVQKEQHDDF